MASENYDALAENDPNPAIDLNDDEQLDAVLRAYAATLDELDNAIDQTYDDLFIETASFEGLDDRAIEVGLTRPDSDSLEQFRTRTRARFGEATSETTLREFADIVLRVLDADPQDITIRGAGGRDEPIAVVETDTEVINGAAFAQDTLKDLLAGSVAAGGTIEIQAVGTFEFSGPDYTPPSGTGFGEGTLGTSI